jgi:hypothetical protein
MATYPTNIEALQALASGANDAPAAGIVKGAAVDIAHVVAASGQHTNRKRLATLAVPQATAVEVAESKRRKHLVESCNFDGDIPVWAQQMQQTFQEQMQTFQQTLGQTRDDVRMLGWKMDQRDQRSRNRSSGDMAHPVGKVIRLTDGAEPGDDVWFPDNEGQLVSASGAQLENLLIFYGLPVIGTLSQKYVRVATHLGVIV